MLCANKPHIVSFNICKHINYLTIKQGFFSFHVIHTTRDLPAWSPSHLAGLLLRTQRSAVSNLDTFGVWLNSHRGSVQQRVRGVSALASWLCSVSFLKTFFTFYSYTYGHSIVLHSGDVDTVFSKVSISFQRKHQRSPPEDDPPEE